MGAPLTCRWTSSDPESGVEAYWYAVGTQAGLSDIANWTNAAVATSVTRSDLTLAIGQSCYVSVKARNHAGLESGVGVSGAITVVPDNAANLIGDARKRPAGTRVYLPGKVVTAVFSDSVFIEEPDRSAGIRCSIGSTDLQAGAVVDVLGKISHVNGEPVVSEVTLSRLNAAGGLEPVCMSVRAITGPGLGANGLLVRVAGRVTKVGSYYFMPSDGSKLTSPRGVKGVEVRAGVGDIPSVGDFAVISGVATRDVVNGVSTVIIRAD